MNIRKCGIIIMSVLLVVSFGALIVNQYSKEVENEDFEDLVGEPVYLTHPVLVRRGWYVPRCVTGGGCLQDEKGWWSAALWCFDGNWSEIKTSGEFMNCQVRYLFDDDFNASGNRILWVRIHVAKTEYALNQRIRIYPIYKSYVEDDYWAEYWAFFDEEFEVCGEGDVVTFDVNSSDVPPLEIEQGWYNLGVVPPEADEVDINITSNCTADAWIDGVLVSKEYNGTPWEYWIENEAAGTPGWYDCYRDPE